MQLEDIINTANHPISKDAFIAHCSDVLTLDGVLVLHDFIRPDALQDMLSHAEAERENAYFCTQSHSVYLTPPDPAPRQPAGHVVEGLHLR